MKEEQRNILVVDDISEYAMVMEIYFPVNTQLISVPTADEAKSAFAENKIDLAIVDVRLNEKVVSDSSGMDLLSWIRQNHADTPVIMISAYMSSEYEMEALERGAHCFLRRPLQPEHIRQALQGVFDA